MGNHLLEKNESELIEILQQVNEEMIVYLFTTFCGTCRLAEQMLTIASSVQDTHIIYKLDANFAPNFIRTYEVKSVPSLIKFKNNELLEKTYAFSSVQDIYEIIRKR